MTTRADTLQTIARAHTWFEIEDDEPSLLLLSTRDNRAGYETPGQPDIQESQRVYRLLRQTHPDLTMSLDAIDEWVSLTIIMPVEAAEVAHA